MARNGTQSVTVVAIVKGEEPFLHEWIAYHILFGVDRFIIYDNDPKFPLTEFLSRYGDLVRVIKWSRPDSTIPGLNNQLSAYEHARALITTEWVAFIDGDEFLTLRNHDSLKEFLQGFPEAGSVSLSWHMFGHNGYFDNPQNLVIASLTRRQKEPGNQVKVIARAEAITKIPSPHVCLVRDGFSSVDANGRINSPEPYSGKTAVAHVNHYVCRSFSNWMSRVDRGDVYYSLNECPESIKWRFSNEGSLRRFVQQSAVLNEHVDEYMLKYVKAVRRAMIRWQQSQLTAV